MKKLRILEREIPIVVLLLVLLAGFGSAALLSYYGQISTTVNIQQAIVLDGSTCTGTMGGGCTSDDTVDAVGSETEYGDLHTLSSNTENDLDVKFSNTDNCGNTLITNMVEMSVDGFSDINTAFDPDYYRGTYYESPITDLDDLETMTYAFRITGDTLGSGDLAPYVVLIGSGFDAGVAVQMIPDGGTYSVGTDYLKTIDSDTTFHVPGGSTCTQANPCTLTELKSEYPSATVESIKLAFGAWPGTGTISTLAGLTTINGGQAVHKSFKVYGETEVDMQNRYDFAVNIMAGTCTITTHIEPVL